MNLKLAVAGSILLTIAIGSSRAVAVTLRPGDILIADLGGGSAPKIIKIDPATGAQTIISSGGSLVAPSGIAIATSGLIFVADPFAFGGTGGIIGIDPATGAQSLVASGGMFARPRSIAVDGTGTLLVADSDADVGSPPFVNGAIIRVDPATGIQAIVSSRQGFRDPVSIALTAGGDILATDVNGGGGPTLANGGVFRIDPVTGAQVLLSANGNLGNPVGIAVSPGGQIFVVDVTLGGNTNWGANAGVIQIDPGTGVQTVVSSGGVLRDPRGVAIASNGDLLVVDARGGCVITPDGCGMLAGQAQGLIRIDPRTGAQRTVGGSFNGPQAIAIVPVHPTQPVAGAGTDQVVNEGELVRLDGSASSDPRGLPLTYEWSRVAGAAVSLDLTDAAHPTFTAPMVPSGTQTLTFQLLVDNGSETSAPASVNITVKDVNRRPVANAGPVQIVGEGASVTLDGSGSYDPDGDGLTYRWTFLSGRAVALSNATSAKATFAAPAIALGSVTLTFSLTVSDGWLSSTASVSVVVEHVNHPPVADAGANQTVNEGTLVTLSGAASSDADGDPLTYAWTQVSGTQVALSDRASAGPSFTAPVVNAAGETLTFQLTVSDPGGLSATAATEVTVIHLNPVCGAAEASPATLWPPTHTLRPVQIVGVTDPNNLNVTLAVLSVTQDEPVDGLGDGDTAPDAVVQGQGVLLRAERAGSGNGRVYVVTFTADDGLGGTCTGTVTVGVARTGHDTAVEDLQLYDSLQP